MRKPRNIDDVVSEILEAIRNVPSQQRRLLSKTFWKRFGFKARSKERIDVVKAALKARNVIVLKPSEDVFGNEPLDDWVVLTADAHTALVPPHPPSSKGHKAVAERPPEWLAGLQNKVLETEKEVELFFVLPLIEALGYAFDDIAAGFKVEMNEGVRRVRKEADFLLFDGQRHSRDTSLVVFEAKGTTVELTSETLNQARSYAFWMATPLIVVTNARRIAIYAFRGALAKDLPVLDLTLGQMTERWTDLVAVLSKPAATARKAHLMEVLTEVKLIDIPPGFSTESQKEVVETLPFPPLAWPDRAP